MRLKLPRIQRRPKLVYIADSWRDTIGMAQRPDLLPFFDVIQDCIESGHELPRWAYRKGIGVTHDELLEEDGIMHLHLGSRDSNELLYLIQYADHVAYLEINNHLHFTTKPIGAVLRRFHAKAVDRVEARIAGEVADRLRTVKTSIAKGLLPKR
ncbi:hypothetical protein [Antarcticirhabdus aurantiaca]|uniref:Uncharacterized protein n=1 Tax=Antarcticirhabdus aurantiaca TaxID=2606717 RepID=A0ACD4NRH7_9HYPH|nr:hypothetical protein [Antarcticirhabdus aurantiaca]WAJ29439.1 hypothetical protein OXU80_04160 [Jeongeuplla avenae]